MLKGIAWRMGVPSSPFGIRQGSLFEYFQLPLGGIGKHFKTDIPTVAIPIGSAKMIKYVPILRI